MVGKVWVCPTCSQPFLERRTLKTHVKLISDCEAEELERVSPKRVKFVNHH